jgi:hypothetical protein
MPMWRLVHTRSETDFEPPHCAHVAAPFLRAAITAALFMSIVRRICARFGVHRIVAISILTGASVIVGSAPLWSDPATVAHPVRIGAPPSLPQGAVRIGPLSARTELDLDVVLKGKSETRLAVLASAVSTPSSPQYRHYLAPVQFADRFGETSATIRAVDVVLHIIGLTRTSPSSDHLFIELRAPVGSIERAFGVSLQRIRLSDGMVVFANDVAPHLPASIAGDVASIIGLNSLSRVTPDAITHPSTVVQHSTSTQAHGLSAHVRGAYSPSLSSSYTASPVGSCDVPPNAGDTFGQIASAYGLDNLYKSSDLGAKATIGLIEFAPYVQSDITTFDLCYGIDPTINPISIDNAPVTTLSGSSDTGDEVETTLDIEMISAMAPQATIDVYDAPENASNPQVLATYMRAIDDPNVQVISTSWGDCETDLGVAQADAEATLFEQAATEGKTIVAASGDEGSEDCVGILKASNPLSTALAVDDPSSQWYVTGVGGTTLQSVGPPLQETVWNLGHSGGAGGGGVSELWAMPSYQSDASASLGVVGTYSLCPTDTGNCREVPDVSANAGTAVAFYCTEGGANGCDGGWTGLGGTSAAAPIWAALFALADESASCNGTNIGFANPGLYAIAGGAGYSSAFNDVTTGNNDLGYHNGMYPAKSGYSLATGLGTPIAGNGEPGDTGLVTQLCDTPRATSFPAGIPAPQGSGASPGVPVINRIRPTSGIAAGHARVTIIGSNFTGVTEVRFGLNQVLVFRVVSSTRIVATSPAGSGVVHVEVITASSTTARTGADKFRYIALPVVLALSPTNGAARGGTVVTITGSSFLGTTAVHFGSHLGKGIIIVSPSVLKVSAPPGSGSVAVTITTPGGTSKVVPASKYRYVT